MVRRKIPIAALLVLLPRAAVGQNAVSIQGGASSMDHERLAEFGVRVGPDWDSGLGADFSFDVYPRLLPAVLIGVTDLTLAFRLRIGPDVRFELRGGGSALLGLGGGAAAFPGYNAGAGLMLAADSTVGLRLDYTYRRLRLEDEDYALPSLTLGVIVRH